MSSPTVPAQVLWQNCGGSSDNFTNTLIDQDAPTPLPCNCTTQAACNAFQGAFNNVAVPGAGNLSAFDGTSGVGTWTLNVADDSVICTGTLTAWSLTLEVKNICPVELLEYRVEGS